MKTSRSLDKGNLTLLEEGYQFIGRTYDNNGIQGYIARRGFEPNNTNVFSVSQIGSVHAQFRESLWYASQNIFVLTPNVDGLVQCKLYLITALNKGLKKFDGGYAVYPTLETLRTMPLQLPILPDGTPDFEYMEAYIAQLEAERVAQLEAYLLATGLADYDLSHEDERVLAHEPVWGEFRVGDLFWITSSKKKFNAVDVKFGGSYPYVARGEANNGIRGYIDSDVSYLNDGNTISFGQDTATMFYQELPYFTGDKIKIFRFKGKFNKILALFFMVALKRGFSMFSWGQSFNERILEDTKIQLPIFPDGTPDFEYMEAYIRVQQKQVIADVVRGLDLEISATRGIVGE